jgi:GAF domain-containing protein
VIAIENARLITETREALEQQSATAEILGVINTSPGKLEPVFDAILEKAHRLCGITQGVLGTFDGEHLRAVTTRGIAEPLAALLRRPFRPEPNSPHARLVSENRVIHIPDLAAESGNYPVRTAALDMGVRTLLFVPLRKDDKLLGYFSANRTEVRPFSDKEIALLENFAAQAVIAMENARLITETREALEQQTATAEVLQVINSSPGDLAPVFDAMLDKAMRLCGAAFGYLDFYNGERFRTVVIRGAPAAFEQFRKHNPPVYGPGTGHARLLAGEPFVHIVDLMAEEAYRLSEPNRRAVVDLGGGRTLLTVALRKDNALLGAFVIYRQEVRPFSDKQIALVQNFAAQAVIAMENARLITETREALEQQTATAEVLQVINSSPRDLAPVFDAILEKAHSLCGVDHGSLRLYEGGKFRAFAVRGLTEAHADLVRQGFSPGPNHPIQRLLEGARFAHVPDLGEFDDPVAHAGFELSGIRTALYIPLRKDGTLLGSIVAGRREVRPFTEKEVALLENFAAQAVVAMENARLLGELRQRTADLARSVDELTATGDVLKIISRSSVELQTVLDTLVETVTRPAAPIRRLCSAGETTDITWSHRAAFRRRQGNSSSLTPWRQTVARWQAA